MRLITLDLDDTLMWCGADYGDAKQQFGEYAAAKHDVSASTAVEVLNEFDKRNVEENGLSMDRFPRSFEDAYRHLADDPSDDAIEHVRGLARSVFKSTEEYGERGYMDGAEELLQALNEQSFELHLITAGDPRVQQRKIDGLGLNSYMDDTHIVPMDTKSERIRTLIDETPYSASETYHIGNSLQSDIRAALEADANAIYIPTHQWRDVDDADYYRNHNRVAIYDSASQLYEEVPDPFLSQQLA